MVRRTAQNGARELLNTLGAGLGYRSMFQLATELPVDVYRDLRHLPPQPVPLANRFPYLEKRGKFAFITSRFKKECSSQRSSVAA